MDIRADESCLAGGRAEVRPFLLTRPDNRFRAAGEQVGSARKDGAKRRRGLKR